MKTYVEFCSNAFPAYEGESGLINPGRYGKRLAEFFVGGLKEKGFEVLQPIGEDWGWVVPIRNRGFRLWIGCGNLGEPASQQFLCFIEPHQVRIRRWMFWTIDTTLRVTALQKAIDELLNANPDVHAKVWWTHDEFNGLTERG